MCISSYAPLMNLYGSKRNREEEKKERKDDEYFFFTSPFSLYICMQERMLYIEEYKHGFKKRGNSILFITNI